VAANILKVNSEKLKDKLYNTGHKHLKIEIRGKAIVVFSEYNGDKENRCRFLHLVGNEFMLSMADHMGKWENTPYTGNISDLADMLISQFGWTIADF